MRIAAGGNGVNSFPGTLELVTYLGSITEYAVRLSSGEGVNVHAHNVGDNDREQFSPGMQVRVEWDPEACQLLA